MKLLREPLLHFLLLGALIFAVFGFVSRHRMDKPGEIVVTPGTVENLVTGFTRTWQRPPTACSGCPGRHKRIRSVQQWTTGKSTAPLSTYRASPAMTRLPRMP